MKKIRNVFVLTLMLTFVLFTASYTSVDASLEDQDVLMLNTNVDLGMQMRSESNLDVKTLQEQASQIDFSESETLTSQSEDATFTYYGGTKYFVGMKNEFIKFHLRSVGDQVEVWVADDLSYGYDRPSDSVTQQQVDMIRDEFDTQIYPTNTNFFGQEDFHDGSNSLLEAYGILPKGYYHNEEGKQIILIENIKDPSYYSQTNTYVSGFYWRTLERYTDRNIITIDSYAWIARMPNENPNYQAYQNDVFGTLAHEFQHLIHDDNDGYEDLWINEGMSGFAQYLNGYGHPQGHVNAFLNQPENSLLIWDDYRSAEVLADYGQAYLLQLYLYDQFGQEFIRELATDTDQSMESLEKILSNFDTGLTFGELFRQFSVAVLIDSNQPGDGIYEFTSIDLKVNVDSAEARDKEGIPAWGGNYQVIEETDKVHSITFDALDYLSQPWQTVSDPLGSGETVLWSNEGHHKDNFVIFEADLSEVTEATLAFDSYINIENNWDFGFVQVSLDEGKTWISLSNVNTTEEFENWVEEPEIGKQLPGLTGTSTGYTHQTFDLSAFVGQTIHVGFRYMTDGAVNGNDASQSGWFIDNIQIPEINYFNDSSSLEGLMDDKRLTESYLEYGVSFVNERTLNNGKVVYQVVSVDLFNVTEDDALTLRQLFKDGANYMITWYASDPEFTEPLPFSYEIITKEDLKN